MLLLGCLGDPSVRTARQLKAFQERELTELDVVALFLDGKREIQVA